MHSILSFGFLLLLALQGSLTDEVQVHPVMDCSFCIVDNLVIDSDSAYQSWTSKCSDHNKCGIPDVDLNRNTLVGVSYFGDCMAQYTFDLEKDDTTREWKIRCMHRNGQCKASRFFDYWLVIPKLPDGYTLNIEDPEESR